ncbi:protein PAT1 homolog 1 isoform X1 [Oncorhynchus mykiss]|uniref:protein PAT1 homolog 1 isoform X1 n=1 Tax=Oncorhynchus mykiss TaxID=8022 RepID=UPI001877E253|nr:protein PAT1 homolog 1 isoform X1 [Oncorhynchus mykiss]
MFRFQSLDEDCTLEKEEGLVEEEHEIDQFNDDTFGDGAIDDDWQEEHKRLAELEEQKNDLLGGLGLGTLGMGGMGGGNASTVHLPPPASRVPHPSSLPPPHHSLSSMPPPGLEERGGGVLAESLAMLILGADPAIASVGGPAGPDDRSTGLPPPPSIPLQHHHPSQLPLHHQLTPSGLPPGPPHLSLLSYQQHQHLLRRGAAPMQQMNSHNIWENNLGFGPVSITPGLITQMEDSPLMSIIKEVGLPNRPPPMMSEDGRDLSERAPPPRSSSPVIGSPPVRAVPIGTPPKQPISHAMNHHHHQQIHHPTAVHVRAPVHHQHRYPPSFPERISPNTLLNIANSPLCRPPFPAGVGPVLSQIQRAQMLNSQLSRKHHESRECQTLVTKFAHQGPPRHLPVQVSTEQQVCPTKMTRYKSSLDSTLTCVLIRTPECTRLEPSHSQIWPPGVYSFVAGFPRGCQGPPLLPGGGGFRPFFGQPPPHRMGPHPGGPPPNHNHVPCPIIRHNTTHLHPQHRRMLTQRMQSRGGERGGRVGDWRSRDPYSNLMSQREKEWVAKIQMMQLQSTDPYLDDYYYQNYFEKLEKRQERDRDGVRKEHTTKLITPQVAKLEHTYRPVQFAGSLGKLTVSSVNNPRKMIDTVVTSRTDDEEKREKQVWDKRRQILYTVEKMYSLLLEVQDFEKRFMQTPEEQREALLEQHKTHTLQLYSSLKEKEWDDRVSDEQCLLIMSVRKGKRLVSRLIPFLPPLQAATVVMGIARNLPALAKKDKQDQVLCWLVEPIAVVISSLSSASLTDLLQELQGSEGQLSRVLQNKFGVTLLYLILSEGERMQSSNPTCQLMDDNRWTELVFSVTRELLNVPSSSLSPPLFTPPNLLSLFSRYVDRQRLELLQEKLQISALSR